MLPASGLLSTALTPTDNQCNSSQNNRGQQFWPPIRHRFDTLHFPFPSVILYQISFLHDTMFRALLSACVASTTTLPMQEFSDADVWLYHTVIISLLL